MQGLNGEKGPKSHSRISGQRGAPRAVRLFSQARYPGIVGVLVQSRDQVQTCTSASICFRRMGW